MYSRPSLTLTYPPSSREGAQEIRSFGILANIDEPACTSELGAKAAHVHIAFLIHLGHPPGTPGRDHRRHRNQTDKTGR